MTYPKVTEINRRTEWEPEQVAPNESEMRQYADQRAHDVAWMTAAERNRIRSIPTVCPKR